LLSVNCNASGCSFYGNVKGNERVGGFGGQIFGAVTDCYAMGSVKGNSIAGGFAGAFAGEYDGGFVEDYGFTATDCYAIVSVNGNEYIGGFVGRADNSSLTNCFSAGTIFCKNADDTKLAGGFVGKNLLKNRYQNCYFDRQMAEIDTPEEVAGIEALPTSKLTNGVNTGFSESDEWIFTPGYYPQLKSLATSEDAVIRLRSALSVVPLRLANNETIGDVQTIFSVADKTPAGDAISWIDDPIEGVEVKNHAVYWFPSEAWRTLTLRIGKLERTVQFRSKKNVITTNINVTANIQPIYNSESGQYIFSIPCGSDEISVFAQISAGGFAKIEPDITGLTLHVNQLPQKVTVTTADNQPPKTYTFEAQKPLPSDIFVQRWNDVLAINNNFSANGGYIFTDYKWYKDGKEIPGSNGKGYIQEKGGLDKTLKYTAVLSSQHGTISTCPANVTNMTPKMAVYPNPVLRGQSVRLETETGKDAARHASTIQLFDTMGNIIVKQTIHNPVADIVMPDMPGQYMLQVSEKGVSQTFKIVVE
jgi:hypothetical protein